MELLLLLSAFLTALTGAITGARPVQGAAQEQVVGRPDGSIRALVKAVTARPVQGWPMLTLVPAAAERPLTLAAVVPTFGQRRRE